MAMITGTESNDVLFGTPGDDYIDGGAGEDGMNGNEGNDTYVIADAGDEVFEAPNQGIDRITVAYDYILPDNVEWLSLKVGILGYGNRFDNLIEANDADNVLKGFARNDVLYGFKGSDTLFGGGGNDRLYGGTGNDLIDAGRGYDELFGGEGNDTYVVESYAFKIVERLVRSSDTIAIPLNYELKDIKIENLVLLKKAQFGTGNSGNNSISGNDVGNVLSGLEGNDTLFGFGGSDTLFGNQENDRLNGGEGNDQLYGQNGSDRLLGGGGNDTLIGEEGNDILIGYAGGKRERDRLSGGEDTDVFVLGSRNQGSTYYLGSGFAAIVDFKRSEKDKIQVGERIKNYRLVNRNVLGSSAADTAIFLGKDLIAVVQDNATITTRDLMIGSR